MTEETELIERVLGDNVERVNESLKGYDLPDGLNEYDFRRGVAIFYNFLTSVNIPRNDSLVAAINLMWSVVGVREVNATQDDFPTIQRNFASGLIGNPRALYSYGISLDQAALKQRAYEMGLAAEGSELNKQQKVLAAYAELTRYNLNNYKQ